jgi:hypothetical protein
LDSSPALRDQNDGDGAGLGGRKQKEVGNRKWEVGDRRRLNDERGTQRCLANLAPRGWQPVTRTSAWAALSGGLPGENTYPAGRKWVYISSS